MTLSVIFGAAQAERPLVKDYRRPASNGLGFEDCKGDFSSVSWVTVTSSMEVRRSWYE